jgi:hypothetical protein
MVSVNRFGTNSGNPASTGALPSLSANGRFVAFESLASDLVANDTNGRYDVFVRDLQPGTTTLVSVNRFGTGSGNSESFLPMLSADGRFVAFESLASDLVATNDTNGEYDVFVRDLQTGITTLVSANRFGTNAGNRRSGALLISANGRFVAFSSLADDLVANDTNGTGDLFVRDLQTGTTTLVSVNRLGTNSGNSDSSDSFFKLSANGRFVAFQSYASDLVANDTNGTRDVFIRDLQTGITTLVSVNRFGTNSGNNASERPALSADGRFVAFESGASDLVANDTNARADVFVRDMQTGTTTLMSVNRTITNGGNDFSTNAQISPDGRVLAFTSRATDLVASDTNGTNDVFVRPVP